MTRLNPLTQGVRRDLITDTLQVQLDLSTLADQRVSVYGGSWRQQILEVAREQTTIKYPHLLPLVVMEQLAEMLIHTRRIKPSAEQEKLFARYQKCKTLSLSPGTDGEGNAAARQAMLALARVLESLL